MRRGLTDEEIEKDNGYSEDAEHKHREQNDPVFRGCHWFQVHAVQKKHIVDGQKADRGAGVVVSITLDVDGANEERIERADRSRHNDQENKQKPANVMDDTHNDVHDSA